MTETYVEFPCDLCGSDLAIEVPEARHYTDGQPIHVCSECGFVYVRRRRSAEAIAASWSDDLFGVAYTSRIPAVAARLTYVVETIDTTIGFKGKTVCDIGAGEGAFLDMIRQPKYGAIGFGIEPSSANGKLMASNSIPHFVGTIEDYAATMAVKRFAIATIMWTLENCQSCLGMLRAARELLHPGGHIVVATGSRILVPFKKPLGYYLGPRELDTHAFRFSVNSLTRALRASGFSVEFTNRFIDHDVLCLIAKKTDVVDDRPMPKDESSDVIDFFSRWHAETQAHFSNA
ncbi:MAG: class I SAM-dependent methyltransferase [Fimbriimonadaceae bacterium]|nr:class I SAM-dependent methyltransferase [Alphaproteobacteria bacterium]